MILRRDSRFRRLKVGEYGLLGSGSYWIGPDHLLIVTTAFPFETYRRFFFSDIQAMICQRTRTGTIWTIALAAWAAISLSLCLVFTFQSPDSSVAIGFWIFSFVVSSISLLLNQLRGPTCVAHLSTAVQTTVLPYLTRWRKAQRLLNELRPLIMAAQSEPAPGQLRASQEGQ
jgi:hypothetical protein